MEHSAHTRETVNMRMVANLPGTRERVCALHHNGTRFWAGTRSDHATMLHCARVVTRAYTLCYPYSPPTLCMHTVLHTLTHARTREHAPKPCTVMMHKNTLCTSFR